MRDGDDTAPDGTGAVADVHETVRVNKDDGSIVIEGEYRIRLDKGLNALPPQDFDDGAAQAEEPAEAEEPAGEQDFGEAAGDRGDEANDQEDSAGTNG